VKPLYYIQGQHELSAGTIPVSDESVLTTTWLETVSPGDEKVCYCNGKSADIPSGCADETVRFTFFDWRPAKELVESLEAIGEQPKYTQWDQRIVFHILVLHQTCDVFMGSLVESELKSGMIPACFDAVLIGDFHTQACAEIARTDGVKIPLWSPGSLRPTVISDTQPKGFLVLRSDFSVVPVSIPQRTLINSPFLADETAFQDYCRSLAEAEPFPSERIQRISSYREDIKRPLVYLKVSGAVPEAERTARRILGDRFHVAVQVIAAGVEEERTETVHSDVSAYSVLESRFEKDIWGGDIARAVLRSDEPYQTLQEFRQRFLAAFTKGGSNAN
jgi:hypothetical protein